MSDYYSSMRALELIVKHSVPVEVLAMSLKRTDRKIAVDSFIAEADTIGWDRGRSRRMLIKLRGVVDNPARARSFRDRTA